MTSPPDDFLPPGPGPWVPIETEQRFSASWLWDFQARYYAERGPDAWLRDGVPTHATSNAMFADRYAQLVWAWADAEARAGGPPPVVVELGAGTGLFAYQLLRRLYALRAREGGPPPVRYVLTDLAEKNLDALAGHPFLRELFDSGLLDVGVFDARAPGPIHLRSGRTLSPEEPADRLAAIANYVFDSIPQDLYFIDGERRLHDARISVVGAGPIDGAGIDLTQMIGRLRYRYTPRPAGASPAGDPRFDAILEEYRRTLPPTFLLLPTAALRCIDHLRRLTRGDLMLLVGDKGDCAAETLGGRSGPLLVEHGSFSLNVNFHAVRRYCEEAGGVALLPEQPVSSVALTCFLFGGAAPAVRRVYDAVLAASPDDLLLMIDHATRRLDALAVRDLLALLRVAQHDPMVLQIIVPRLTALAPRLDAADRLEVVRAIDRSWRLHLPLPADIDLAFALGALLHRLGAHRRALDFFGFSEKLCGSSSGTLFNMAVCHLCLGAPEAAVPLLERALVHDPDNAAATDLLARCRPPPAAP